MANPDHVQPGDPPWLKIAFGELGTTRDLDPGESNPQVEKYHQSTAGGIPADGDQTDWCSSFVNWCVEKSHIEGTNSKWAQSWLNWSKGRRAEQPTRGCIVVFERGVPGSGFGHVGFYLGGSRETTIRLLGGNQGHRVSIANHDGSRWLGYRLGPDQEEKDHDMTGEQAHQLKAIYDGLTVFGTTSPSQTVDLMFKRIATIEDAINVQGTRTAQEAFEMLFTRVRRIENMVENIQQRVS
jgi:uncharacterized protein (TIGR02594 family)